MTLFEHETEQIVATAKQRTIGNAPGIAVKDLLAADIPHPLKTYFRTYVQSLLEEELHEHHSSSRFKFDHHEVQGLQKQINSILIMQYVFEEQEFLQQLDDAVHLIINYLVRPQWTLRNFAFTKGQEISSLTLIPMLRYFGPFEYLKDLLYSYVRQRHVTSFTDKEFSQTMWKLDGEYIRRKTGEELAVLLKPMYEFISYPAKNEDFSLPVKSLVKHYEDKGLKMVVRRLEELEAGNNQDLTWPALAELLESVRAAADGFSVEPTWVDEQPVQPDVAQKAASPQPEQQTDAQPKQEEFISIEAYMDEGERKRFIKKIFRQSENAFLEAVDTLNAMPTWKQATVYIDEIFIRYGVDPYSTEAERFLEVVRQRFYSDK